MQVSKEVLDDKTVRLHVEVDAERVAKTYEKVYRELSKYVRVKGFRPGKAPISFVKQELKPEYVFEEVAKKLINPTATEAMQQEGVEPFMVTPDVEALKLEEGEPMSYDLDIPTKPEATLGTYKGLKLTKCTVEVTDEQVEEEITSRRKQAGTNQRVDEAADMGHTVFATITPHVEGEPNARGALRKFVVMNEEAQADVLEGLLFGMKASETKEETVTFPEDYKEAEYAGLTASVAVQVHGVSKIIEPTDEQFLEKSGSASMEDLTKETRERMVSYLTETATSTSRRNLETALMENNEVTISRVLVMGLAQRELENQAETLRHRGYSLKQFLEQRNMTPEQYLQQQAAEVYYNLYVSSVLEAIVEAEGITATDEELEARLETLIAEAGEEAEQAREAAQRDEVKANVRQALATEKAIEWLWSESEVTEQDLREFMAEQTAKRIADQTAAQAEVAEIEAAPEA
ncbi:MAG: trigger factor [Armatimonadota bacterium]